MKKFLNRIGSPLRKDRKKKEKDSKSSEKRKNRLRAKTSGMALGVLGAKYFYKNSKSEKPLTPSYITSSDSMGARQSFKTQEENVKKKKTFSRRDSQQPVSPPPSPPKNLNRIATKDIMVSASEKDLLDCSESMVSWLNQSSGHLPAWSMKSQNRKLDSSNSGRLPAVVEQENSTPKKGKQLRKRVSVDVSILPSPEALQFSKNLINDAYARQNASAKFRVRSPTNISKIEAICMVQRCVRRYLRNRNRRHRHSILHCVSKVQQNRMIMRLQLRLKRLEFENQELRHALLSSGSSSGTVKDKGLIDVVRLATESANGSGFKGLSQPTQQQLLLGQLMGLQSSLALFYRNAKRKSTR